VANLSVPEATVVPAPRTRTGFAGQIAWAIYDGSRAPYSGLVTLFVFSAYFTTVVIPDPVRGQAIWSYVTSVAAVVLAVGAPIFGAVADAGGRRKPWIAACVLLAVPSMAALWFATPGMGPGLGWIVAALIGSGIAFEYAPIFGNAMLPDVAPRERIGWLSGLGLALSNVSNFALLLFFLFAWSWNAHPLFGLDPAAHEPQRAVGPLAAIWYAVFCLPLFFLTPDAPATRRSKTEAIRQGLHTLSHTIGTLRRHRNVTMFLVARMVFGEGFIVLMMFTGIFAAGVLHWTPTMLVVQGLINSVCATLAGLAAGWLDGRIGSQASTMVFVGGCLFANILLCSIGPDSVLFITVSPEPGAGLFPTLPDKVFAVTQAFTALFVTAGLASSRALMAKLSPAGMLAEFFGLFALSGTATSFVGPLAIGLLTTLFHSQRAGVSVGVAFLLGGLLLLTLVREQPSADPDGS
jgi:UMF1 family MFS transporter